MLVVGINLVISQLIWNMIAPKILGDALDLPLPVIIVGVFVGAAAGGVLGAFLAAPILATLRVIISYCGTRLIRTTLTRRCKRPSRGARIPSCIRVTSCGWRIDPLVRAWVNRVMAIQPRRFLRRISGEK